MKKLHFLAADLSGLGCPVSLVLSPSRIVIYSLGADGEPVAALFEGKKYEAKKAIKTLQTAIAGVGME